jgi:nucleoside-diphosphate-sugar epimerase
MSLPSTNERTCLLTGARGYLGSHIATRLRELGWRVVALVRNPGERSEEIRFRLGERLPPEKLAGASALIHCAYDFAAVGWKEIHRINVLGSETLFRSAKAAGVERLVFISSISAYENCRSLYGKAKLETEALARAHHATVLRPGLIWGMPSAGMFGRLEKQVANAGVLPLFGEGSQIQFMAHETDLARHICAWASGELSASIEPVTLAHEQPWPFRQILEELARFRGKRVRFLPVPWRAAWAGLKAAESIGYPLRFRSDSLVSLMHQNPSPSFALQKQFSLAFRPFRLPPQSSI